MTTLYPRVAESCLTSFAFPPSLPHTSHCSHSCVAGLPLSALKLTGAKPPISSPGSHPGPSKSVSNNTNYGQSIGSSIGEKNLQVKMFKTLLAIIRLHRQDSSRVQDGSCVEVSGHEVYYRASGDCLWGGSCFPAELIAGMFSWFLFPV